MPSGYDGVLKVYCTCKDSLGRDKTKYLNLTMSYDSSQKPDPLDTKDPKTHDIVLYARQMKGAQTEQVITDITQAISTASDVYTFSGDDIS